MDDSSTPKQSGQVGLCLLPTTQPASHPTSWEGLLTSRHRLELLVFSGKEEYEPLIEHLVADCYQLSRFETVIYLIDFDVLRNYLELRTVDRLETLAVDFLFKGSTQPYALPKGAYYELCEWLSHVLRLSSTVGETDEDLSREDFVTQLAELLGVARRDQITTQAKTQAILGKLMD